jgi:hypothetical protein
MLPVAARGTAGVAVGTAVGFTGDNGFPGVVTAGFTGEFTEGGGDVGCGVGTASGDWAGSPLCRSPDFSASRLLWESLSASTGIINAAIIMQTMTAVSTVDLVFFISVHLFPAQSSDTSRTGRWDLCLVRFIQDRGRGGLLCRFRGLVCKELINEFSHH